MKTIITLASLLAVISLAAAYAPEQQATVDGLRLSFQLGQAYEKASQGQDIQAFNSLVEEWNAWVSKNFANDASLLMKKMAVPVNLQKPYVAAGNNTTSKGIVHDINSDGAKYTANDINIMSDSAIAKYAASEQGKTQGAEYLGGI